MEQVALGWIVYQLTDSPFLLGALMGMRSLPFLVFGPLAGVAADRMDRKRLMLMSQVAVVFLYVLLVAGLAIEAVQVWHLFAFTLVASVAWAFNQPARHSLIPDLVPRDDLVNAIALQSLGHNITRVLGPTAAGVLLASVGAPWTFGIVTATLFGVLVTTLFIPSPPPSAQAHSRASLSIWQDLVGGADLVRRDPMLLGLMLLSLIPIVVGMSYMSLAPVFARDVFGLDSRGVGELMAASGVGAVVGTVGVASLRESFGARGTVTLASGVALGISLVAFAVSTWYPLSLALMALVGLFSMSSIVLTHAAIQMAAPRQYMGRVMSIFLLDRGLMPLGSFAAGAVAQAFGGPAAITLMGGLCTGLILLVAVKMPHVRSFR